MLNGSPTASATSGTFALKGRGIDRSNPVAPSTCPIRHGRSDYAAPRASGSNAGRHDDHRTRPRGAGVDKVVLLFLGATQSNCVGTRGRTGGRFHEPLTLASLYGGTSGWRLRVESKVLATAVAPQPTRTNRARFRLRPASNVSGCSFKDSTPVGLAVNEDEGVVAAEEVISFFATRPVSLSIGARRIAEPLSRDVLQFLQSRGAKRVRLPRTVGSAMSALESSRPRGAPGARERNRDRAD